MAILLITELAVFELSSSFCEMKYVYDIEVPFADTKELLGLGQYQLMTPKAIRRLWTLVMVVYCFIDEERVRHRREQHRHITIGDAWRYAHQTHWRCFVDWMRTPFGELRFMASYSTVM